MWLRWLCIYQWKVIHGLDTFLLDQQNSDTCFEFDSGYLLAIYKDVHITFVAGQVRLVLIWLYALDTSLKFTVFCSDSIYIYIYEWFGITCNKSSFTMYYKCGGYSVNFAWEEWRQESAPICNSHNS